MATAPEQFGLKLIFDAGVAFMAVMSGGLKDIAPPEMPRLWVIMGTVGASAAFFAAKVFLSLTSVRIPRDWWLGLSVLCVLLAFALGIAYLLTRAARTVRYDREVLLAGKPSEYLADVKAQNPGKTREELILDAAGDAGLVWTAEALSRSRRILGMQYTLFISLLAFGLYLGIEAYNTPKPDPAPTFAEQVAGLHDVHFALDATDLSPDAADLLTADAKILKDAFRSFNKATVILEGYCDDRGSDGYNFALGYKRAEAVRQALVADGIAAEKLRVSSHGRNGSSCQVNDEPCRGKNRRVRLTPIQN